MGIMSKLLCGGVTIDPTFGDPVLVAARDGVIDGDYRAARALMLQTQDLIQREYIANAICADQAELSAFQAWTADFPNDANGWILLGISGTFWAWEARTDAMAKYVSDQRFMEFFDRLGQIDQALQRAIALAPRDPLPYAQRIYIDVGLQRDKQDALRHFGKAIRRQEAMRMAHSAMHMYLCEKWFGSRLEMFNFARGQAQKHWELVGLIPASHIEHWLASMMYERSEEAETYFHQPVVREEVQQAFDAFRAHPQHQPIDMYAANMFAFCFIKMEDQPNAREAFEIIGERFQKYPWAYDSVYPARTIHRARLWANA